MSARGRNRDPNRENFSDPYAAEGLKTLRVNCIHCEKSVSDSASNRKTHLANCRAAKRAKTGMLELQSANRSVITNLPNSVVIKPPSVAELLGAKVYPSLTSNEKETLNQLLIWTRSANCSRRRSWRSKRSCSEYSLIVCPTLVNMNCSIR